ncbi:hypothetical protein [Pseudoalteromonas carrageenovora]|uniref:hypothetical protein n=1 Tax=Pseudoalteromonas carrageenovora TaxID=227 RepID=UPI0026E3F771|nr:hypothetical protein [Pseudoalteromonas carrageenovora]MDO6462997.1 hypothetical protein [Pseudoalteromonas carrageenovora]MDO6547140.1 hypothetical protein [Pseudoalteromonas carrageenovora]MDO6831588.1 hypothetical protein [Pseudoalteromonas carrageenovora]
MRLSILAGLLTFISCQVNATIYMDKEKNITTVENVKYNKKELKYKSGALKQVQFFNQGKRAGTWLEYYENGNLKSQKTYGKAFRASPAKYWDESGKLKESVIVYKSKHGDTVKWINYEENDIEREYHKSRDGRWVKSLTYAGKKRVLVEEYESAGSKDTNRQYIGRYYSRYNKKRYLNEKGYKECFYKKGVLHGPYIEVDERGEIILKGKYSNGNKVGEWFEQSRYYEYKNPYISYQNYDMNGKLHDKQVRRYIESGREVIEYYSHGKKER